jgi:hypothetical protein
MDAQESADSTKASSDAARLPRAGIIAVALIGLTIIIYLPGCWVIYGVLDFLVPLDNLLLYRYITIVGIIFIGCVYWLSFRPLRKFKYLRILVTYILAFLFLCMAQLLFVTLFPGLFFCP